MTVYCIWEHNGNDTLIYARDFPGAFARGESLKKAIAKIPDEIRIYLRWRGIVAPEEISVEICQEKNSDLNVKDADSDVLFLSEENPLSKEEYEELKGLALRSAKDFQSLYDSIPDKDRSDLPCRKTFYGDLPRTASEMYTHTKSVNAYYFGEIDVTADNLGTIYECRKRAFSALESIPNFLNKTATEGSYGEYWSLRKLLRRFLWHDRIHGKAMWRMATRVFGEDSVKNPFFFEKRKHNGQAVLF